MQAAWRTKEKEKAAEDRRNRRRKTPVDGEEGEEGEQPEEEPDDQEAEEEPETETVKQAVRSGPFSMCRKAGLGMCSEIIKKHSFYNNLKKRYDKDRHNPLVANSECRFSQ